MKIARHVDVRATAQAIGRATRLDAEVVLVVLRRTETGASDWFEDTGSGEVAAPPGGRGEVIRAAVWGKARTVKWAPALLFTQLGPICEGQD